MPKAAIHDLPNKGPYHKAPKMKPERDPNNTPNQLISDKFIAIYLEFEVQYYAVAYLIANNQK